MAPKKSSIVVAFVDKEYFSMLLNLGGFYKLALSDFEAIFGSERQRVRKYSGLYDRTRWRSESKRGQKMAKRNPSSFIPFLGGNL